jgi:hypothetical protein
MAVEARSAQSKSASPKGSQGPIRGALRKAGPAIPYAIGGLLLVAYFVWMCIEMSHDAPGGGAVPLSIFGGVLLGVLAGGASMLGSRRDK